MQAGGAGPSAGKGVPAYSYSVAETMTNAYAKDFDVPACAGANIRPSP